MTTDLRSWMKVIRVDLIINMSIGVGGCGDTARKWKKQLSHGYIVGIRLHRCG